VCGGSCVCVLNVYTRMCVCVCMCCSMLSWRRHHQICGCELASGHDVYTLFAAGNGFRHLGDSSCHQLISFAMHTLLTMTSGQWVFSRAIFIASEFTVIQSFWLII
jgi:hypothetical protein